MKALFLDLKAQSKQIEPEVVSMVRETMASGVFVGGTQVSAFENEYAEFCESRFCIGVGSGTDALRFALMAAGVSVRPIPPNHLTMCPPLVITDDQIDTILAALRKVLGATP